MNTLLKNVDFGLEIRAFLSPKLPASPMPILHALADAYRNNGLVWMQSEEAKALVHTLNSIVHGPGYQINGQKEQDRLTKLFGKPA